MVIYAHFEQLNYDLQVFNIFQSYHSNLIHLCEDLRVLPFLYFIYHIFCTVELWLECFEHYPYIQMWQYMLMCGEGAKPVAHLMKYHL